MSPGLVTDKQVRQRSVRRDRRHKCSFGLSGAIVPSRHVGTAATMPIASHRTAHARAVSMGETVTMLRCSDRGSELHQRHFQTPLEEQGTLQRPLHRRGLGPLGDEKLLQRFED